MQLNKLQIEHKTVQLILPVDYEHIVSFREVVRGLSLRKFIKTSQKRRHDYEFCKNKRKRSIFLKRKRCTLE